MFYSFSRGEGGFPLLVFLIHFRQRRGLLTPRHVICHFHGVKFLLFLLIFDGKAG